MKVLHTSDWHLGKTLEGFQRLDEQKRFLDDLVKIGHVKARGESFPTAIMT